MIHNLKINILLFAFAGLLFAWSGSSAQEATLQIKGTVKDSFGKPLPGVTVNSGPARGTVTNSKGEYTILKGNEPLTFSYNGYTTQQIIQAGKGDLDITLKQDMHRSDELVYLGYTSQRRGDISGAVSTVTGEELERAPVANLTQTFPGRLAGLTAQEVSSELSRATTNLYVRGISAARGNGPLVMIDGIINSYNSNQTLDYISANEIESVTLLKDASTQALYGIQGANGIMVITTKRGNKGDVQIKTTLDHALQEVTTKPLFYSSAEYAAMRNQAALNDGRAKPFTDQQIEGYKTGTDPRYSNNNWYDRYMADYAAMQRAAVNVTGGNDNVQFYSNVNFMHQGGQFITDQTEYNPNANNVWVNYRSNVDMNLNRYLKAFVRLAGNIKRERTPGVGNATIYSSLFQIPPTMYGPLSPDGKVLTTQNVTSPTYGMLNRTGYTRHTVTNITSQFGLDLDMGFLTKGLKLNGTLAYQTNSVGSLSTTQDYERFIRSGANDTLAFIKKGAQNDTPLAYGKSHSYYYHLTYNTALNYQREFGKHNVGGMAYMFYQNLTKADNSSPGLLPYNRVSSGAELSYGYDSRYLVKFDIGYSGSEQYARSHRFTATPAVSAAWVASNEGFMNDINWLSNLKLRASYGKTANDNSGLGRFAYLDNVTVSKGGPIGYLQYLITQQQVGNPYIEAEIATKQNLGLDLGFFNALSISLDVFKERMDNMVVGGSGSIPLYQGVPLGNYPRGNTGVFENKGYELIAAYTKALNSNLSFSIGGQLSYIDNKVINVNEPARTADYAYPKLQEGFPYGQQFGYLVDYSNGNGFYNTAEELENRIPFNNAETKIRLGDLKYQDLNGDGLIDLHDRAPIGYGALPKYSYGISGGLTYKAFDLNFLFQGIGKYTTLFSGQGVYETDIDGIFGSLHKNAWTPERYASGQTITAPALSIVKSVSHEASDYYSYDRSFIRLKNMQLGYTLPSRLSKAITADKIRFLLSGQNLITWDNMKSDDFGPDGGGYNAFPVYRVYNIGVNVIF